MLKKWECSKCGRQVLAFKEDMEKENVESFQEIKKPVSECTSPAEVLFGFEFGCIFSEIPTYEQSTLHGEAGFSVEGTVLDSTDSIHDHEKSCIEKAADERELKHVLVARKDA